MEAFQALLGDDFCFLLSPHIVARTPRKRPIMTPDHADKMEITVVFQCPPVLGSAISVALGLMKANLCITFTSITLGKLIRYIALAVGASLVI